MVSDSGGGCVFGSGMCATHNEKLTRSVCVKRVCEKNDECGGITWMHREVTSLTCPAAKKVCLKSNAQPKLVSLNKGGPANKKTRLSNMSESESTSEGSDDRRLPGLVKRQH